MHFSVPPHAYAWQARAFSRTSKIRCIQCPDLNFPAHGCLSTNNFKSMPAMLRLIKSPIILMRFPFRSHRVRVAALSATLNEVNGPMQFFYD